MFVKPLIRDVSDVANVAQRNASSGNDAVNPNVCVAFVTHSAGWRAFEDIPRCRFV